MPKAQVSGGETLCLFFVAGHPRSDVPCFAGWRKKGSVKREDY